MNCVCVVPVWLQEFLTTRGLPFTKIREPGWLESILSKADVRSYETAQRIMGLPSMINIVEPLFTKAQGYRISSLDDLWGFEDLLVGIDRKDPSANALVFYRALVCGVSYDSATVTKEQAPLLDFDFHWDGETLYVVVKRAGSSLLEPTVRAAILERLMACLRQFMTLDQVAANELFSRWLRETQRAQG